VDDYGRAVIADFALARLFEENAPINNTASNQQMNTLRWQAPEVINYEPFTISADVYSWSMTALEIMTDSTYPACE